MRPTIRLAPGGDFVIVVGILGGLLIFAGFIVAIIGYIRLILLAFRLGGTGWGIGSIFISLIGLIFGIIHWNEGGKSPVMFEIAGYLLLIVGYILLFIGIIAAGGTTTTTTSLLF
ncbi:MAG TPA: hypothetical protein VG329_06970 [Candidatus Dormibacteraeota bacterium]|jgi:hypothetical protein|nr:hypothetical protein [Candidatus Dormibacteraeota bacterium]